jgi:hypothetical protein
LRTTARRQVEPLWRGAERRFRLRSLLGNGQARRLRHVEQGKPDIRDIRVAVNITIIRWKADNI